MNTSFEGSASLTRAEESSLRELFLRGIAKVGMPSEMTPEAMIWVLRAGLDASQEFAQEMLDGRTERSQLAREVLCSEVYGQCQLIGTRQKLLNRLEDRARAQGVARARLAMFNEVVL